MSMLDFLFLLALLFGLFSGYARGLVGGVARIAAYLVSLAVASRVAGQVGQAAGGWIGLPKFVREMLARQIPPQLAGAHIPPEQMGPVLDQSQVPQQLRDEILRNLAHQPLLEAIAVPYSHMLETLLGLLLVTTVLYLLILALTAPLIRMAQLVMPRWLDRSGGLVLGLFLAILELAFFALFLSAYTDMPNAAPGIQLPAQDSQLLPALVKLGHAVIHLLGAKGLLPGDTFGDSPYI